MDNRIAIIGLALSATGLVYIAQREGYSAKAYPDPVHGAKVATIGYGTTSGVKMGDTTTPDRALVRLRADAAEFEVALKRCIKVPLYQHEWDAYVALAYNVGTTSVCLNTERTGPSTIVRNLNAGQYNPACEAILLYDRAGPVKRPQDLCSHPDNRTCRGVWKDRKALRSMCLGEPVQ
ncbi:lysozyme [Diaphorobacter caeni]|uniref:lysozyme n=1 Tax=Diaphorobacter caeni TaxID=2784387 RepID=UPI00188F1BA7|nr:lysozyme [Diaphorobacter caeni]MBF5006388.1 lysozyme [Diaphorobacter caeni]